jgi:hypothetical protein
MIKHLQKQTFDDLKILTINYFSSEQQRINQDVIQIEKEMLVKYDNIFDDLESNNLLSNINNLNKILYNRDQILSNYKNYLDNIIKFLFDILLILAPDNENYTYIYNEWLIINTQYNNMKEMVDNEKTSNNIKINDYSNLIRKYNTIKDRNDIDNFNKLLNSINQFTEKYKLVTNNKKLDDYPLLTKIKEYINIKIENLKKAPKDTPESSKNDPNDIIEDFKKLGETYNNEDLEIILERIKNY